MASSQTDAQMDTPSCGGKGRAKAIRQSLPFRHLGQIQMLQLPCLYRSSSQQHRLWQPRVPSDRGARELNRKAKPHIFARVQTWIAHPWHWGGERT